MRPPLRLMLIVVTALVLANSASPASAGPRDPLRTITSPVLVKGLTELMHQSGHTGPSRCFTFERSHRSSRWAAARFSEWAWSNQDTCHPNEGDSGVARRHGRTWKWTGAGTGGGRTTEQCLSETAAAGIPRRIASDFCAHSFRQSTRTGD